MRESTGHDYFVLAHIFLLKPLIRFVGECRQADWTLKHCLQCPFYHVQQTVEMKDVLFRKVSDPSISIIQLLD